MDLGITVGRAAVNNKIIGVYFLTFFSRMLLSKDTGVRGLGPNPKIFEKYFLE